MRVGVGCSEGRFGVDGTWRRSWEDGPVRMGRGAGGGLTWGHRLRPSQTGVRVAPASLPRATAAFPGPTRNPSRPERGAGAGAPAVPASPGSCTRPGRGDWGGRAAARASSAPHPRSAHRPRPRAASSSAGGQVLGSGGRRRCRGSSYPRAPVAGPLRSRLSPPWPPFRTGPGRRSTRPPPLQRPARRATPREAAPGSGEGGKRQARLLPTRVLSFLGGEERRSQVRCPARGRLGPRPCLTRTEGSPARGLPGLAGEAWGGPGPHRR